WLRALQAHFDFIHTRRPRREPARRRMPARLWLERLEDRTVPTSVTVLASNLHTVGGIPEPVPVAETGTPERNGVNVTFNAAPGIYPLDSGNGGVTYGSFTLASDGTISGTTGALTGSGSTVDFDLSKLAAVSIFGTDLKTAAGLQQHVALYPVMY